MERKPLTLQKDVAEKYYLKAVSAGTFHFPGHGEISLHTMSLEKADQLYASGFPFLVLKKKRSEENAQS